MQPINASFVQKAYQTASNAPMQPFAKTAGPASTQKQVTPPVLPAIPSLCYVIFAQVLSARPVSTTLRWSRASALIATRFSPNATIAQILQFAEVAILVTP
jgi:hypothetical protein